MLNTILVTRLFPDAKLPTLGTERSVGADVYAYLMTESGRPTRMMIPANATRPIRTGIVVAVDSTEPAGKDVIRVSPAALLVCSRSGLAKERAMFVTNAPGVIDPDYRGELIILVHNGSMQTQWVEHGDRIAQLLFAPIPIPTILESAVNLAAESTSRGTAGFGSTGR